MLLESKMNNIKNLPLGDLGFHIRVVNVLKQNGIFFVYQLLELTPRKVSLLNKVGPDTFFKITETLSDYGLSLKNEN